MAAAPEYIRLEARRLRQKEGLSYPVISELLGVSQTTVYRWINPQYAEQSRRSSRKAKLRRTGICEDCGTETRYSGHGPDVSRLCVRCSSIRTGFAKKVWTRDAIVAAIQWWGNLYGKQPAEADFNPTLSAALGDYQRTVRAERHIAEKKIPWFTTVIVEFGSWNAAITAAGFTSLPRHGGGANVSRRRKRFA